MTTSSPRSMNRLGVPRGHASCVTCSAWALAGLLLLAASASFLVKNEGGSGCARTTLFPTTCKAIIGPHLRRPGSAFSGAPAQESFRRRSHLLKSTCMLS